MNERLKAKMQALYDDNQKKGGGLFGKIPDGISRWRIVPYKNDKDGDPVYFFIMKRHYMGRKGGYINCPESFGQSCKICAWEHKHYKDEDELHAAVARKCYASVTHIVNAVEIETKEGKQVATDKAVELVIPKAIYDEILDHIVSAGMTDLLDVEKGKHLVFKRTQLSAMAKHVKYSLMVDDKVRPITTNAAKMKRIMDSVIDFSKVKKPASDEDVSLALKVALHDPEFKTEAVEDYRDWKARKRTRDNT